MKRYEFIREIFNNCANSRMRDVDMCEIETENVERVVEKYAVGSGVDVKETESADASRVFEITSDGLRQKLTFTEL